MNKKRRFSVAIDGPAGAGKSSVAKEIAKKFNIFHLDTGALYRAVAYYCLKEFKFLEDEKVLQSAIERCDLKIRYIDGEQQIFIFDERVDYFIRNNEIAKVASYISKSVIVREFLLEKQRDFAKNNSVIMDGRDIGTVVLPFADLKIFLTASLEVRALRRFRELKLSKCDLTFEDVLKEIERRDLNDSKRKIAPLKVAKDAIVVDTSNLSLKDSIFKVLNLVEKFVLEEHFEFL